MLQFDPTNKKLPHFVVPFSLPSLNEYLTECNRSPRAGAQMKREYTTFAVNVIRHDLKRWKTDKPIIIHYHFYEHDMKRDHDNVFSMASKCIQDALIKAKVISNDGWKNIENFTHDFFVDAKNPRIEVWLEEIQ